MTGGYSYSYLSNVELFPRPSSDACFIPQLPEAMSRHSLSLLSGGRLVVCGGSGFDSCLSWVAGNTSWTPFYNMRCLPIIIKDKPVCLIIRLFAFFSHSIFVKLKISANNNPSTITTFIKHNHSVARYYHTAWVPSTLPDSIVLLGGTGSAANLTAEIVPGKN